MWDILKRGRKKLKLNETSMNFTERDFKQWKAYEKVRRSGKYNMVIDCGEASKDAGLSLNVYSKIFKHYMPIQRAIIQKYGSVENYLNKVGYGKNYIK